LQAPQKLSEKPSTMVMSTVGWVIFLCVWIQWKPLMLPTACQD